MEYENTPAPESIEIEVVEVLPQEGAVIIQGPNGLEGKFQVVAPASINWASTGKATAKFTGEDISYLRMTKPKAFGQSNSGYSGGYKKPYNSYQRQPYGNYQKPAYTLQPASQYKQASPMTESNPVGRDLMVFYEDVTGFQLQEIYAKINSVCKIKATQVVDRQMVETEMVGDGKDKKELIHKKYDAFIYVTIANGIPINSIKNIKIEEKEGDGTI